jgi:hypothetical protein
MTALVLDAGALIAIDRDDRAMAARLRAALDAGLGLRTHTMVIAQVWRDPLGRQASLARLLRAVEIVDIDDELGRAAGILCGRTGRSDPIDAAVALIARAGDNIITSDPDDLSLLVGGTGTSATVIAV